MISPLACAGMKVFISSDMEGTAGVVDWAQCIGDGPEALAGKRLLLAEVNAAIEGAVSGGATEVLVNDSHSTMRNLPADDLAADASYLSGQHKPLYMMQGLDATFDAVLFVSYHGSMGAPAGMSHTYNPSAVVEVRLDGTVVGEAGINALVAAHYGVPIVLVTGDRQACEETAQLLPGIRTAVVKDSVSRMAAQSLHPRVACELIRSRAADRRGRHPGGRRAHDGHRGGDDVGARRRAGQRAHRARRRARPALDVPVVRRRDPVDAHSGGIALIARRLP